MADRRTTNRTERRESSRARASAGWTAYLAGDRVGWGAIWGGLLTAIGLFLLLSFLLTAIGVSTLQAGIDAGTVDQTAGIVAAIIGLVAFFVGGFVAGAMGPLGDRAAGPVNGFLVWALANVLILVLAAFGLGQVFGAAGALLDIYQEVGFNIQEAAAEIDRQVLIDNVQVAAWTAFFGLLLSALAATLGGWMGAGVRGPDPLVD